jgi:hypothetical protein
MTKSPHYRRPVKPAPKPCPECGRKVLAGLDGRAAALPVVIDAEVLTREGELVNIVNSVKMYATNPQGEILRRTAGEILHHVAMLDIHRVHDCEHLTPAHLVKPAPVKPAVKHCDKPPF